MNNSRSLRAAVQAVAYLLGAVLALAVVGLLSAIVLGCLAWVASTVWGAVL